MIDHILKQGDLIFITDEMLNLLRGFKHGECIFIIDVCFFSGMIEIPRYTCYVPRLGIYSIIYHDEICIDYYDI